VKLLAQKLVLQRNYKIGTENRTNAEPRGNKRGFKEIKVVFNEAKRARGPAIKVQLAGC
jgi:hypothetical protein